MEKLCMFLSNALSTTLSFWVNEVYKLMQVKLTKKMVMIIYQNLTQLALQMQ